MKRYKVYLSHSIRGKYGNKATKEQMQNNCNIAILFSKWLRKEFTELEIYCPAEHDEFILKAFMKNYLNVTQILDVDCDIIAERSLLLVYCWDGFISEGMMIEIDYAQKYHIPILFVTSIITNLDFKKLINDFFMGRIR